MAAASVSVPSLSLPITTRRLHIRDYVVGDAPTVFGYVNDPAYWQFQRAEPPTAQQIDTLIKWVVNEQSHVPRLAYFLAVTRKDTGEVVGEAVLKIINAAERQGELGFGIAPRFWKQGYGTETTAAILEAAFAQLKLHRLSGQCSAENKGSMRIMQKVGMAREGLLRDVHFARGKWWSTVIYGVLEHEYAKIRSALKT
jgi:[ribosomal protein S5]-alanine N-acetyltransferase